eukprot:scaffold66870_cov61-Attheya_sp.AAC.1
MRIKECGSMLKKGGSIEAFSGVTSCSKRGVMGTDLSLEICFNLDVQLAEGGRGCGLGVAFGGPGVLGDAGAMAGFVLLGRWFHHRKVGKN